MILGAGKPGGWHPRHGLTNTPTYGTWQGMMRRCHYPRHRSYHKYGARGIRVCRRWWRFIHFVEDMGIKPEGKQLDRKRADLGYSKRNCRWLSNLENNRTRRNTLFIKFRGRVLTLKQWAVKFDYPYSTLAGRYYRGWDARSMLTTPREIR